MGTLETYGNYLDLTNFHRNLWKFFDNNITLSQTSPEGYAAQCTKSTTPHCGASFSSSNQASAITQDSKVVLHLKVNKRKKEKVIHMIQM